MRTRNRFLPVLLLVLAAPTLAVITAPVANAARWLWVPVVTVDPGDPDENGAYNKSSAPPSSGMSIGPADAASQTYAPRASVLEADTTALAPLHKGEWRVRDILLYVLFRSPVLR
jgi:hypothetical protein